MDLTTAFISIVGLIVSFNSERRTGKDADKQDFLKYLQDHNHTELIESIKNNSKLAVSLDYSLKQNQNELIEKLNSLNSILLSISTKVDGLRHVAEAIAPSMILSEQALSILKQAEDGKINSFSVLTFVDGEISICAFGGNIGSIELSELRFLDDDLNKLVELGFLILDFDSGGGPRYIMTRQASEFINLL